MAPTVDGVIACFRAVVNASPETTKLDPYTSPVPFDEVGYVCSQNAGLSCRFMGMCLGHVYQWGPTSAGRGAQDKQLLRRHVVVLASGRSGGRRAEETRYPTALVEAGVH